MRNIATIALIASAGLVATMPGAAYAQSRALQTGSTGATDAPTRAASGASSFAAPVACRNPGGLGVSRVVEVDAESGPRFGQLQYKDLDFLKDKEVVLTFDDGPLRRFTRNVLEALDAHCTKGTFFMVGRMAVSDPEMVREVARHGHAVGTHTWSHANLKSRNIARAIAEFELGLSAVQQAAGKPILPFFRFPYLADSKAMVDYLKSRDVGMFSIDVDSYDYRTPSGRDIRRNVLSQLESRGKGIILFHDIQRSTARGLLDLLDDLKARGFKVVHLVAKSPVKTLPEYDAEAGKLLAKRNIVATARPLTVRSLTWQMPQPGEHEAQRSVTQPRHRDPASEPKSPEASTAAIAQPRPPAPAASDDWRRTIFER